MELNGKVAVITGAAGGIGSAAAHALSDAGMRLVLTDRDAGLLGRLVTEIGEADTAQMAGDITDPELPERLFGAAIDRFGRVDVLFNNAGMMHVGAVDAIDLAKVTAMVRVNVEAVYRMAYVFARRFKAQGSGHIVNTSSIAGLKPGPTMGAYAGTKAAIEAFTDALRVELAGTGVGVSAIEPGTVDTGLYKDWADRDREYVYSGGALAPQDIARCLRFMLEQPPHVLVPRLLAVPAAEPV